MRDDRDLWRSPRRPAAWRARIIGPLVVIALLPICALLGWLPDDIDDVPSLRGAHWDRRMPLPGLLPPAPTPAPVDPAPATPEADEPARSTTDRPADAVRLVVIHVIDGDTIEVGAAHSNTIVAENERMRVRLIGIDAPERTPTPECWSAEARFRLSQLLPEGSTVWAAPDVELRDRYDRALLYLWTDDGLFVNLELVAAGDAEAIRVQPNVAFYDLLAGAQAEAEASGAGRWGACR